MSVQEISYRAKKAIMPRPQFGKLDRKELARWLSFRDFSAAGATMESSELAQTYQSLADNRLDGIYDIFDLKDLPISEVNWRKDYQSGKEAPYLPAGQLDYRAFEQIGDIKYIWELNRHQFLIPVAIQYFLSGREAYKRFVIEVIQDWLEKNPYSMGINWTSCLELGARLASWYFVLSFLVSRDRALPEAFAEQMAEAIFVHAFHIQHNPSLFSSANNHLIGEKTGLVCAGALLRNQPQVTGWLDDAVHRLTDEANRQVYGDGVGAEQSPAYQAHTVGYYVLCTAVLEDLGRKVPRQFLDLIDRSAQFYESIMDIQGNVPDIGDNDGGVPIYLYASDDFNVYRSVIGINRLLKYKPVKETAVVDPNTFWLFFDRLGRRVSLSGNGCGTPTSGRQIRQAFPDGGYFVLGQDFGEPGEVKIVFDCGPLGFGEIAAHGHADALAFTLVYEGTCFLVDPGTYKYFVEPERRAYFRSTAAHNTVRIDRRDQSEMLGPFLWGHRATARLEYLRLDGDTQEVAGTHDGYLRHGGGVLHRRRLVYDPSQRTLTVFDRLEMSHEHLVEMFYHTSSECRIEVESPTSLVLSADGRNVRMQLDQQLDWRIARGETQPWLGWHSHSFGEMHETNTLLGISRSRGLKEYRTEIRLL
ncbi:MAG: heparinase II/III domain-containing protein [Bacteroidota bacterium]